MKRPAWVAGLLYRIHYQLATGFGAPALYGGSASTLPPRLPSPSPLHAESCMGCGKVGTHFCRHCRELNDLTQKRTRKLWSTLEGKFSGKIT
jgi:hypothetical protein